MRKLLKSTARSIYVLAVAASDHNTGAPGVTLSIQVGKDGGALGAAAATYTDRGNGIYAINLPAGDTDTLGDHVLNITGTAGTAIDPIVLVSEVIAINLTDAVRGGLTALPNANAEAAGGLYTRGAGAGQINQSNAGRIDADAQSAAAGAVTSIQAGLATTAAVASIQVDTTALLARITAARAGYLDNLNVGGLVATGAAVALTSTAAAVALIQADTTTLLARLTAARAAKIDNLDATVSSRLAPLVAGRAVNVDAAGAVGINMAAISNPDATVDLINTTIKTASTIGAGGIGAVSLASDTYQFFGIATTGQADGGTANTIALTTPFGGDPPSSVDDAYKDYIVVINYGSGGQEGQAGRIASYNGTTKIATMCEAWAVPVDDSCGYTVFFDNAVARVPSLSVEAIASQLATEHGQGQWGPSYPLTQAQARATMGFGSWDHGYLFDGAGLPAATWGGLNLIASGAPVYQKPGILGSRDLGLGFDEPSGFLIGADDTVLDVGPTRDFAIAFACAGGLTTLDEVNFLYKYTTGPGTPAWHIGLFSNSLGCLTDPDSPGFSPSIFIGPLPNEVLANPFVVVLAICRSTATMCMGVRSSTGFTLVSDVMPSFVNSTDALRAIAGPVRLGEHDGGGSGDDHATTVTNMMISIGADVAIGMPENLADVLTSYGDRLFGPRRINSADGVVEANVLQDRGTLIPDGVVNGWDLARLTDATSLDLDPSDPDLIAFSTNALPGLANVTIEWTPEHGTRVIGGLTGISSFHNYPYIDNIGAGIRTDGVSADVIEFGGILFSLSDVEVGDRFKVESTDGANVTNYYRNDVVIYSSPYGIAAQINAVIALRDRGIGATDVVARVGGLKQAISWVSVTPAPGTAYSASTGVSGDSALAVWPTPPDVSGITSSVAAIKSKTDNLPPDPADASDIAAAFATVNATLATIAGYIDTEIATLLANLATAQGSIDAIAASVNLALGLAHRNGRIDTCVYGASGVLISARLRVFANAAALAASVDGHANGADGEINRYTITAVDNGNSGFSSYTLSQDL